MCTGTEKITVYLHLSSIENLGKSPNGLGELNKLATLWDFDTILGFGCCLRSVDLG